MSFIEELRKEMRSMVSVQEDFTLNAFENSDDIEAYAKPEKLPTKFPLIWLYDKVTEETHLYGTNKHDSLSLDSYGSLHYRNMQNGEGTGLDGDYKYIDFSDPEGEGSVLEITMDEIRNHILGEVIEKLEEEAIHGKNIGRKQCEGMARAINIVRSFMEDTGDF